MKFKLLSASFALTLTLASALTPADATGQGTNTPLQPYVWKNVKVAGGGFIPGIIFSAKQPDLAYCRTDIGSSYKWDNSAKRWLPLTDWNPVSNLQGSESLATDPVDPNRLYIAQGMYANGPSAIMRSMDQGKTFQVVAVPFRMGGNEFGRSAGERLAIDPNDHNVLYFGSRHNGLWISKDAALGWAKVDSFPAPDTTGGEPATRGRGGAGLSFVIFDNSTGTPGKATKEIYVGSTDRAAAHLYRSRDAGKTWLAVPGQPTDVVPIHAAFDTQGILYLVYDSNPGPYGITNGAVWKFNPKNDTWSDATPLQGPHRLVGGYGGLAVDRQQPGTVMVASLNRRGEDGGDRLYRSKDGGTTWKDITDKTRRDPSASPYLNWGESAPSFGWWIATLDIDPFNSKRACYATGATIWRCEDLDNADVDKDTHWTVWAEGIEETAVLELISPPAGPHLISGFGDIGTFTHDDLDVSPTNGMHLHPLFTTATLLDYAEKNPNIIIRGGSRALHIPDRDTLAYSLDAGRSWTPFKIPDTRFDGGRQTGFGAGSGPVMLSADGSTFLSTIGGQTRFSRDRGVTWAPTVGLPQGIRPVADRFNAAKFYAVSLADKKTYRSTDGAATFVATDAAGLPEPGGARYVLRPTPGKEGDLWLVGAHGMYHSRNGGASFTQTPDAPSVSTMGFGMAPPGKESPALFVAGRLQVQEGVFRSDDAGANWVRINDDRNQWGNRYTCITGDPRVYGRVYVGTDGRGIFYGDIAR
jgi:photosystem II stability/assembly factor-like uncharacterized protein